MSALPKRQTLLTAAQLQLLHNTTTRHARLRSLQTFSASSSLSSLPPPSPPVQPSPSAYPPPPYPALLSLPHSSPHAHSPPPARPHRPPKKSSTTLFPAPPNSAPASAPSQNTQGRQRALLTWSNGAADAEGEEKEGREAGGHRWTFRAGASGLPKNGGACVTRGGGVVQVGEDCYFVLPDSMGVSDGVGGLKGPRCNPGLFALSLITHASSLMSPPTPSSPSAFLSPSPHASSPQSPNTATHADLSSKSAQRTPLDPHPALLTSHALTLSAFAMEGLHGSATCTLARMYPEEGLLRVAHVGDCELWCVRGDSAPPSSSADVSGSLRTPDDPPQPLADPTWSETTTTTPTAASHNLRIVFRTPAMQRSFNHPHQLSTPSPPSTPGPSSSHPHPHPHPPEIQTYTLPIRPRDIVLLSSDGLADNLWEDEILAELSRLRTHADKDAVGNGQAPGTETESVQEVCDRLVRRAKEVAMARRERQRVQQERERQEEAAGGKEEGDGEGEGRGTPFERRAREAGKVWKGGKNDDISVVLAVIEEFEQPDATPATAP